MSRYDDIIHLPHHVSEKRARMPLADRAAQFSPFAALTGYDGVIAEAGRLTQRFVDLDETAIGELDLELRRIAEHIQTQPLVTVTWFVPDNTKDGGSYRTVTAQVKKLDTTERLLLFTDRTEVPFYQITELQLHL